MIKVGRFKIGRSPRAPESVVDADWWVTFDDNKMPVFWFKPTLAIVEEFDKFFNEHILTEELYVRTFTVKGLEELRTACHSLMVRPCESNLHAPRTVIESGGMNNNNKKKEDEVLHVRHAL